MIIDKIAQQLNLPLDHNVSGKRRLRPITLAELLNALLDFETAKSAALFLGISRTSISEICKELFPDKESKQYWSTFLYAQLGKKKCSSCQQVLDLDRFRDDKQKGKHTKCEPCLKAYGSERYFANKDQHRLWNQTWREQNPGKANAIHAKRRANKLAAMSEDADLELIKLIYEGCPEGYQVDHVVPIARGGKHHEDNLCYLPASLNAAKRHSLPEDVPNIMTYAIFPLKETDN